MRMRATTTRDNEQMREATPSKRRVHGDDIRRTTRRQDKNDSRTSIRSIKVPHPVQPHPQLPAERDGDSSSIPIPIFAPPRAARRAIQTTCPARVSLCKGVDVLMLMLAVRVDVLRVRVDVLRMRVDMLGCEGRYAANADRGAASGCRAGEHHDTSPHRTSLPPPDAYTPSILPWWLCPNAWTGRRAGSPRKRLCWPRWDPRRVRNGHGRHGGHATIYPAPAVRSMLLRSKTTTNHRMKSQAQTAPARSREEDCDPSRPGHHCPLLPYRTVRRTDS